MPMAKGIVQELTRINFIRSFRTILRIIFETLVDYCIGKVDQCDKLFPDVTGRRHISLHNLDIGVID